MATRTTVINDPVGIHARPAAQFSQAVTASGCTVTIAKEGGNPVPAGSILSIMGLGIKQGDSVVIDVQGADDETVADNLLNILSTPSDLPLAEDFRISQDIQQSSVVASQLWNRNATCMIAILAILAFSHLPLFDGWLFYS